MALEDARGAGRSLARLMSAIVTRPVESPDIERIVTIPDHGVELEVLRELQALDAEWIEQRETVGDARWIG